MGDLADYLWMGGYAAYVWPSYAVTVAILGGLTGYAWQRYRASIRVLDRLQSRLRPRR